MKRFSFIAVVLIGFAFAVQAQTTAPATQPASPAVAPAKNSVLAPPIRPRDRYDVLAQRNMFVRHESNGPTRIRNEGPTTRPSRTESWLLTGTAVVENRSIAFVENTSSGVARRVRVGDTVGGLRIAAVDGNGVEVESSGSKHRVALGASFDGSAAPTTMPSPSSETAGGSAGIGGGSEASILERMRARRNQEMNK